MLTVHSGVLCVLDNMGGWVYYSYFVGHLLAGLLVHFPPLYQCTVLCMGCVNCTYVVGFCVYYIVWVGVCIT